MRGTPTGYVKGTGGKKMNPTTAAVIDTIIYSSPAAVRLLP